MRLIRENNKFYITDLKLEKKYDYPQENTNFAFNPFIFCFWINEFLFIPGPDQRDQRIIGQGYCN